MSDLHSGDEKIIRMANQIATFFDSQPVDSRIDGIANHINKFWEQRMKRHFFQLLEKDSTGFHPQVVEAARHISRPPELASIK